MKRMWTSLFWKDLGERVIATIAQVLLGIFTADGFNLLSIDATGVLVTVATAAILVVLKGIVAANISKTVSPASLAKDERGI